MRIIGLTGRARAGKDTVAQIIIDELTTGQPEPPVVKRQGFADKLKESAAAALGHEMVNPIKFCDKLKTQGNIFVMFDHHDGFTISGRQFLQWFGTEAHRDVFGQDFWLDAVLPSLGRGEGLGTSRNDCDVLVIPDVRFDNEAERVLDCGGEIWEVRRDEAETGDAHQSELGVPPELVKRVIHNNGTLEDLRLRVRTTLFFAGAS